MHDHPGPVIDVIIPTLALEERANCIRRAIESVRNQRNVAAVPIVVINGDRKDALIVAEIEGLSDARTIHLAASSLPAALAAGRRAVTSDWFAELDDDDVLTPDALDLRLQAASGGAPCDVVITNGILRHDAGDVPAIADIEHVAADPLAALETGTWLNPGAALFRTAAVGPDLFENMPAYLEWTYLAARLVEGSRLKFLDESTYIRYPDSPLSTWQSDDCVRGLPQAIEKLLTLDLPRDLRAELSRRLAAAANRAAQLELTSGHPRAAWRWHLKCLGGTGGWRYLPFTRHLLRSLIPARSETS